MQLKQIIHVFSLYKEKLNRPYVLPVLAPMSCIPTDRKEKSIITGDDSSFGKWISLAQDQRLHPVGYVSSDVSFKYEIG